MTGMSDRGRLRLFSDRRFVPEGLPHAAILWPFWGPAEERAEWIQARRFQQYAGTGGQFFELVTDIADASVAVLPVHWNRCVTAGAREAMLAFAAAVSRAGKRLLVFFDSDSEEVLPFRDAITFRPSLYRSHPRPGTLPLPGWSGDLVANHCGGMMTVREKSAVPVVGFCGATGPREKSWIARMTSRNYVPVHETDAFALRNEVLDLLEQSGLVRTNFIRRRGYFGGSMFPPLWRRLSGSRWNQRVGEQVRSEFVENIRSSDYVVCVRGSGNFSTRMYETLCMGRIPLIIDTDCVVPFAGLDDWKKLAIWCPASDIASAGARVAAFHDALKPQELVDRQRACRRLWQQWLSPEGFFAHLAEMIGLASADDEQKVSPAGARGDGTGSIVFRCDVVSRAI